MKIAIAGFGVEGRANLSYWNTAEHEVTVVDERNEVVDIPEGVKTMTGDGAFSQLSDFDMVVRTAGLSPHKITTNGKIWSATNEFFAQCPTKNIIGVTGTKGKGTTCSLIANILEKAGKRVHLVGNIGQPALDILPSISEEDIVVFELSSFQLWDLEKSPHISVVLMIEADHLDVHEGFEDYINAKANIRRFQSLDDVCLYHPTNLYARSIAEAPLTTIGDNQSDSVGKSIYRYGIKDDGQVFINNDYFAVGDRTICPTNTLKLPGQHNIENACAAMSAVLALDLGITNTDFTTGLESFKGLPHRLEYVKTVDDVQYFDDSFSSATPATKVALASFSEPTVLIIGGYDRGINYDDFTKELASRSNLAHVVTLGQTGPMLAEGFIDNGFKAVTQVVTLHEAVTAAKNAAIKGGVVVMSPGCASFDMFKNFTDRGEQFKQEVYSL